MISLNVVKPPADNYWQCLFAPSSVAVIGASNTPGTWGFGIMQQLLRSGEGEIYPVNPKATEVLGRISYDSIVSIPGPIDLAVIAVSASHTADIMRQCVQKGVKAVVVISAGFAETGKPGYELEKELLDIARQGGVRFVGPNSIGHANILSGLATLAWAEEITRGPVGVISQSGNYGQQIIRDGVARGIGFSKFISTGNEGDLHLEDYLEYLGKDEDTKLITLYIEGLREGRRFFQVAREITAVKPVIAIKTGGTKEAARAVSSHTGAMAGSDDVYAAAFRQAGVIRVNDTDEMCDLIAAMLNMPLPPDDRVGILTIGGGPGVLATEACEKEGLTIARLAASTMEKLNSYLPSRWSHANPVDVAGMSARQREIIFESMWELLKDKNIDAVLLLLPIVLSTKRVSAIFNMNGEESKAFREMHKKNLILARNKANEHGKPILIVLPARDDEAFSFLCQEGIPAYFNPGRAVKALSHLVWYKRYLDAEGR